VSRRGVICLIPILLTLHNAEEAIAFHRYWSDLPGLLPTAFSSLTARLSYADFLRVLATLSLIAFLLAAFVNLRPERRWALWLLLAMQATVGLNVLGHVASAAFVFHGYGPGLMTALLFNAPFTVYCFMRVQRERWISRTALWATIPAAFVLHGPVLIAALWITEALNR
jgi:hypothetical protein